MQEETNQYERMWKRLRDEVVMLRKYAYENVCLRRLEIRMNEIQSLEHISLQFEIEPDISEMGITAQ